MHVHAAAEAFGAFALAMTCVALVSAKQHLRIVFVARKAARLRPKRLHQIDGAEPSQRGYNVAMAGNILGFAIAIALILAGILFNRQDNKDLRATVESLRNDMNRNFFEFYRTLGQHDARLDNLEKRNG